MSKLLALKEWLTVAEAAKYLSSMLDEAVLPTDVLRLALDGRLCLSVYLVNGADAKFGQILTKAELEKRIGLSRRLAKSIAGNFEAGNQRVEVLLSEAYPLDENTFVRLSRHATAIDGVWDLLLIGNDRLDVERLYQSETDGVEIELISTNGVFLKRGQEICQLQGRFTGHPIQEDYFPASGIPRNAILVVRAEELLGLIQRITKPTQKDDPRQIKNMAKVIYGMAKAKYGYDPTRDRNTATGAMCRALETQGIAISEKTLRAYIKQGQEAVDEDGE